MNNEGKLFGKTKIFMVGDGIGRVKRVLYIKDKKYCTPEYRKERKAETETDKGGRGKEGGREGEREREHKGTKREIFIMLTSWVVLKMSGTPKENPLFLELNS